MSLGRRCVQAIRANYKQGGLYYSACSFGTQVINVITTDLSYFTYMMFFSVSLFLMLDTHSPARFGT